jgi:hypothetical protein
MTDRTQAVIDAAWEVLYDERLVHAIRHPLLICFARKSHYLYRQTGQSEDLLHALVMYEAERGIEWGTRYCDMCYLYPLSICMYCGTTKQRAVSIKWSTDENCWITSDGERIGKRE